MHCIFRLFNVVLKFYYCIFIRLFKCNSSQILDVNKFSKIQCPALWRPALKLNGLSCVNKVLVYFTNYKNLFCQTSKKLGSSSRRFTVLSSINKMSVIITVKTVKKKNNKRRKRIILKNKHDGNFCEKKNVFKTLLISQY